MLKRCFPNILSVRDIYSLMHCKHQSKYKISLSFLILTGLNFYFKKKVAYLLFFLYKICMRHDLSSYMALGDQFQYEENGYGLAQSLFVSMCGLRSKRS